MYERTDIVELSVRDLVSSGSFFLKVFGWKYEPLNDPNKMGVYFEGRLVMILRQEKSMPPVPHFEVDDIESTVAFVESYGGEITQEIKATPDGRGVYALFNDLDGNTLGLFQKYPDEDKEPSNVMQGSAAK